MLDWSTNSRTPVQGLLWVFWSIQRGMLRRTGSFFDMFIPAPALVWWCVDFLSLFTFAITNMNTEWNWYSIGHASMLVKKPILTCIDMFALYMSKSKCDTSRSVWKVRWDDFKNAQTCTYYMVALYICKSTCSTLRSVLGGYMGLLADMAERCDRLAGWIVGLHSLRFTLATGNSSCCPDSVPAVSGFLIRSEQGKLRYAHVCRPLAESNRLR